MKLKETRSYKERGELIERLSKELGLQRSEIAVLEKALELMAYRLEECNICKELDFTEVPLRLHAITSGEWLKHFKQQASEVLNDIMGRRKV